MPPRPEKLGSTDFTIRFRWWAELQLRLERLALFYECMWHELAGPVLEEFSAEREEALEWPDIPVSRDMPALKHGSPDSLSPVAQSTYRFLTGKLALLRAASSTEERERIMKLKFGETDEIDTSLPPSTQIEGREVPFYEDLIAAGVTAGTFANNPPSWITVPPSWKLPVDFVVKVHGDSMTGFIEDGELAAFVKAERGESGRVVAALSDGQIVIKLYNDGGDGPPQLLSYNLDYDPIPVTRRVRIQGLFVEKFPLRSLNRSKDKIH